MYDRYGMDGVKDGGGPGPSELRVDCSIESLVVCEREGHDVRVAVFRQAVWLALSLPDKLFTGS